MSKKRYNRKNTGVTISIFYEQYQLNKYNFTPEYQRDFNIWTESQKSFLIDTIMKNFPMPPIFLEQKIDDNTGKTLYDVIDGKQRLSTIINFIENKVKVPDSFGNDIYGIDLLNDKSFDEIKELSKSNEEVKESISEFWSYVISVEYIENPDYKIADNIFDRLNRGGERLNSEELRKANYYDTIIYTDILRIREDTFFKSLLSTLNSNRLEDVTFITELYLLVYLEKIIDGTEDKIDNYFKELIDKIDDEKSGKIIEDIRVLNQVVNSFNLDFDKYKINGVSHLYALYYLALYMKKNGKIVDENFLIKLNEFYNDLRLNKEISYTLIYHKSMQSASKYRHSRKKRVLALLNYFEFDVKENDL